MTPDETQDTGEVTRVDPGSSASALSAEPIPLPRLPEGDIIGGRFRVSGLLGRGGFGEVYRVVDTQDGRELALKLHRVSDNSLALESLKGEFELLRTLRHPNLARVYDFGYVGEAVAFFTQDIVAGVRLDRADLELGERSMVPLLAQLCRALSYLHARGILHRDLKPSNILVDRAAQKLTLLDFGISRAFGPSPAPRIIGTHAYMSPEAIRGDDIDARADLYSLGATLYQVGSGRLPFASRGVDLLYSHLQDTPPPMGPPTPTAIEQVIQRLLEKEPGQRYASAAELLNAIGAALSTPIEAEDADSLVSYVLSSRHVGANALTEQLLRRAEKATADAPPIVVIGEAGTGKSRLLRELRQRAQLAGRTVVSVAAPRTPERLRLVPALAQAVLTPKVLELLSEDDRRELARAVPSLRKRGERLATPVDPARARARRIEALGRAISGRFSARRGLLALEGLHLFDVGALTDLQDISAAARKAGAPCQLLLTGRPGGATDRATRVLSAHTFECAPLSSSDCRSLVASVFGDVDFLDGTTLGERIHEGDHSPLWLQESLRLAVESKEVVRQDGTWVAREPRARNLAEVLEARVNRLRGAARQMALASAVAQAPSPLTELAKIAGYPLAKAAPAAGELVRQGMFEEAARAPRTYAMQERYVEAVLSISSPTKLRAAHRRAARFLSRTKDDPLRLARAARHFESAGDSQAARQTVIEASRAADRAGRPDLGHRLLEDLPLDIELLLWKHDLSERSAMREATAAALSELERRRSDATPEEEIEIDLRRARQLSHGGNADDARSLLKTALREARSRSLASHECELLSLGGEVELFAGRVGEALACYEACAERGKRAGLALQQARGSLGASLTGLYLGDQERSLKAATEALQATKGRQDGSLRSDALRQLGNVQRAQGKNRKALGTYRRAVLAARGAGDLLREAKALNNLGTVAQWTSQVGEAQDAFLRSIDLKDRIGAQASKHISLNNLGALLIGVGRHEEAETILRALIDETDESLIHSIAQSNLADLHALLGAYDDAIARYRAAARHCEEHGHASQATHAFAGLSRTLLLRGGDGDRAAAREVIGRLAEYRENLKIAEASRRYFSSEAMWLDAAGEVKRAVAAAREGVRTRDRKTLFSDVFGTELDMRWIHALTLQRMGRSKAAAKERKRCQNMLREMAAVLPSTADQRTFLFASPLHRAIDQGVLDTPPGAAWPRPF
ncbi:MAG: protein kinase [Myxococcota bacterium]